MADGREYPAKWEDEQEGTRLVGRLQFTDSTDEPLPNSGGTLTGNQTVTGNLTVQGNVALGNAAADTVAFYGAAGIAQQTGVAVTAGGIHAALVALGLITA